MVKSLMPTEPPMEDQPLDDEWIDNEYAAQAYEMRCCDWSSDVCSSDL